MNSGEKVEDAVELRFRTSRHVRFYCSWVGERGKPVTQADVRMVMRMFELMLDTFDDAPTTTPPSEYGDQPDDPDAGVYEREPDGGEGR